MPFPHSSQVDGQLREVRCHYGRDLYRIFYQRSGNLFVLLHALEKRSGALPKADVELAKARFADFRTRMDAKPKRPPPAPPATTHPNTALIRSDKVTAWQQPPYEEIAPVPGVPSARRPTKPRLGERARVLSTAPSRPRSAGCREIAWLLIKFRMDKGLSQQDLADLVGTSHSQISRIESGRHRTNLDTLTRIAHALDLRLVLGFEAASPSGKPKRELVAF